MSSTIFNEIVHRRRTESELRKFIQSPINRINSEIHLEKKQKASNKGKYEPLIRIIEHFIKGRHEPHMRIIEPPWKITEDKWHHNL